MENISREKYFAIRLSSKKDNLITESKIQETGQNRGSQTSTPVNGHL